MENIENDNAVKYRKTKLVKSKNNTEYRRCYYLNEAIEKVPENIHPKQEVKHKYIKTTSKSGKAYYKHPPELYKELHTKHYGENKEKICRRAFLRNLKSTRRCPHDKSITYYNLTEHEVEFARDERLKNEPIENHERVCKIYSDIIERIHFLNN